MDETVWVGIDVGRHAHHAAAVDEAGSVLWSRRLPNDQPAIEALVDRVAGVETVVWAIDMTAPESALLRGVLAAQRQHVRYVPGRVVHSMTSAFVGEGKTDARDAVVIAQTARLRGDLAIVSVPDDVAIELDLLTGHRSDLVTERTRGINRLRGLLTRIFPALERCFDYSTLTGLAFLTRFATPSAIAVASDEEIYDHLRGHGVRRPTIPKMISKARAAAAAQTVALPGEATTALLVQQSAASLIALTRQINDVEKQIAEVFHRHRLAPILESVPGIGTRSGAELVAITGGDPASFGSAAKLAAYAGLAPVPHHSGNRRGTLRRPQRYHRGLRKVFFMAALNSSQREGPSREFYRRKRGEKRSHIHALIALARRLVDVVWALIRDNRTWRPSPGSVSAVSEPTAA
ncbi:IS110 family transposase [Gordonia sp. UCD-TK1]|uniref:IS110 family transposase n=1 Tax=unclassified Gordonia (in: high G+C Gram-positive bacteria) TaxID=2657482 RepID=UPI00080DAD7C|nr:IS110 family transposase [Gordonia sp. UCD-TK1]OCH81490.1 transposase [Gordonia sp. UCD-TK1]